MNQIHQDAIMAALVDAIAVLERVLGPASVVTAAREHVQEHATDVIVVQEHVLELVGDITNISAIKQP